MADTQLDMVPTAKSAFSRSDSIFCMSPSATWASWYVCMWPRRTGPNEVPRTRALLSGHRSTPRAGHLPTRTTHITHVRRPSRPSKSYILVRTVRTVSGTMPQNPHSPAATCMVPSGLSFLARPLCPGRPPAFLGAPPAPALRRNCRRVSVGVSPPPSISWPPPHLSASSR